MKLLSTHWKIDRAIAVCVVAMLALPAWSLSKPRLAATTGLQVSALAPAQVGVPYLAPLAVTGGTAPYRWTASGLPAGLELGERGILHGTPTAATGSGFAAFVATVSDSSTPALTTTANFALLIVAATQKLAVVSASLPAATAGTAYSAALNAQGGVLPYKWSLASGAVLPTGLSLSTGGAITGTPSVGGSTFTFAVTVNDSSATPQSATVTESLLINPRQPGLRIDPSSLPNAVVGSAYSYTLPAKGGTAPYSFASDSTPAGLTLTAAGLLGGTPTTASAGTAPTVFQVTLTDSSATPLTVTVPLKILISPGITISTLNLPSGTAGVAYSANLAATGGVLPYKWILGKSVALPAGLSLSSTGVISGTPTAATVAAGAGLNIYVQDSSTTPIIASATVVLLIKPASGDIHISSVQPPSGTVGTPYSFTFSATGGQAPYVWAATNLPAGLVLNSAGAISGTPTTARSGDSSAVVLTIQDSATTPRTATAKFQIAINPSTPPVAITSTMLPPAYVGGAYSTLLQASGGVGPYTWSLGKTAVLPAGLSLSPSGQLSGTPTALPVSSLMQIALVVYDSSVVKNGVSGSVLLNIYPAVVSCTNDGSGNAQLKGQYAFSMGGTDAASGSQFKLVGNWAADGNGNLTAGVMDANAPTWTSPFSNKFAGTYSIGSDHRGILNLTGNGAGSTYCFVADQVNASGVATGGWLMRADQSGQSVAGTIELQDATAFTQASLKGNYVFGLQGGAMSQAGASLRTAMAGYLVLDGLGNVSAGQADMSQQRADSGVVANQYDAQVSVTGSYTVAGNGRGTLTLQPPSGDPSNFVFQVVSNGEIRLVEINNAITEHECCNAVLSGQAIMQTGSSFSAATLSGPAVYVKNAQTKPGTLQPGRDIEAGILSFDGKGNLSLASDENAGGTVTQNQSASTYKVDAHGRVVVQSAQNAADTAGLNAVFYLAGPGRGFGVNADLSVGFYEAEPQTVPSGGFSQSAFSGAFGLGSMWLARNARTQSGAVTVTASGTVSAILDTNKNGAISTGAAQTGFMTAAANGRFLLSPAAGQPAQTAVYLVSPTKAYMIDIGGSDGAPFEVLAHQ